jgi:HSP20 family molecular chaperone IbpA
MRRSDLENLFGEGFTKYFFSPEKTWVFDGNETQTPHNSSTREEDGSVVLTIDLPGVTPENLEVRTENGKLYIKGTRADKTGVYSINHPMTLEGITAKLAHGVLTVRVPTAAKDAGQKIEVQVG